MNADHDIPDVAPVMEPLLAFRRSKAMFAGVELGVFDLLANGPASSQSLATSIGAHQPTLERLLDTLVGLALLERDADLYRNSPAATTYLVSSSPRRMTGYIHYSSAVGWKLWEHLADAVREGTHRWKQVYGWDAPIFSHFFRDEESKREFLMGMNGFGMMTSPKVVRAFDLSGFTHLVDVGGATGHLAIAACEAYPTLRATVFDLPETIPLANDIISESSVSHRIETVGGDFFQNDLPKGDLYYLGRILHDWSDEKSLLLLRKILEALPENGALLVGEILVNDERNGPEWAQLQDLNMLVCTEGRERTLAGYTDLLKSAGYGEVSGAVTGSFLDAILARKS